MKKAAWVIPIVALTSFVSHAQQKGSIDGRIRLYDGTSSVVEVVNNQTNEKVNSDATGYYMISASQGDTLRFSSAKSAVSHYIVTDQDLTQGRVNIVLVRPGENLEEIIIVKKDLGPNFFDLQLQTPLTQAERNFKVNNTLTSATSTGGLGINIGALVNLFSGKRKADKQAIVYEKMQLLIDNLVDIYPKEDIANDLSIPDYLLEGYLIYLVNQPDFHDVPITHDTGYLLYLSGHYQGFLDFIEENQQ